MTRHPRRRLERAPLIARLFAAVLLFMWPAEAFTRQSPQVPANCPLASALVVEVSSLADSATLAPAKRRAPLQLSGQWGIDSVQIERGPVASTWSLRAYLTRDARSQLAERLSTAGPQKLTVRRATRTLSASRLEGVVAPPSILLLAAVSPSALTEALRCGDGDKRAKDLGSPSTRVAR